jgi:hypothetical protein
MGEPASRPAPPYGASTRHYEEARHMTEDTSRWIWIPNWDDFQHYRDRRPTWIKNYLELLNKDEYLDLTLPQRGLLHGIWMETARRGNGRLRSDIASLSRALGLHEGVRIATRDSLVHAGFIELVASKSLATRYQAASPEVLLRKTKEERRTTSVAPPPQNGKSHRPLDPGEHRDAEGFLY